MSKNWNLEEEKRRNGRIGAITAVFFTILFLAGIGLFVYRALHPPQHVVITPK